MSDEGRVKRWKPLHPEWLVMAILWTGVAMVGTLDVIHAKHASVLDWLGIAIEWMNAPVLLGLAYKKMIRECEPSSGLTRLKLNE